MRQRQFTKLGLILVLILAGIVMIYPANYLVRPANTATLPAKHSDMQPNMLLPGPFTATVLDVIDGDTFEARVTIWLGHEVTTRVRLLGIDSAEMDSGCTEVREMARASRLALKRFLGSYVTLKDVRLDKYGGRVLARVETPELGDISNRMLADGYAIAYDGGRRQAWCPVTVTTAQ